MYAVYDLPDLEADIAELAPESFAEAIAVAYLDRDRDEFLRLGQRLVREVVLCVRGRRVDSYRSEMYSEGLLALIQQFDKTTRQIDHAYAYFRVAVRRAIFAWARQQKIIRRKGAKHGDTLLDADISSRDDFDATIIQSVPARPSASSTATWTIGFLPLRPTIPIPRFCTACRTVREVPDRRRTPRSARSRAAARERPA